MNIKPATIAITIALLLISGCGNKDRAVSKTYEAPSSDMKELTGMLQIVDPEKCPLVKGCGPQFSLLGRNLKSQIAIEGDFSLGQNRHILTVSGTTNTLPADLADKDGYEKIKALINVQKYEVRSKIAYHPFLVDEATKYTTANYGCDLLWDKSYSWTIEDGVPQLQVKMTNTFSKEPQPWVQLSYDGNSGELISVVSEPTQINPCDL